MLRGTIHDRYMPNDFVCIGNSKETTAVNTVVTARFNGLTKQFPFLWFNEMGGDSWVKKCFVRGYLDLLIGTLSMRVNKFDKNTGKVTEKNENPVLKIAKRKEQIDSRVQLVADYVVLHPREKYTPQKMAEMVELSKQRFSSLFKANMGKSPMEYVREIRLTTAARALLVSNKNINDIAYECGYEDANYFIREFKSAFGFTPNQYRKIARE